MSAKESNDVDMSIGEHLDELRVRIIRSVVVLLAIAVIAFIFKGIVLDIIFAPMNTDFPTNRFFGWLADLSGSDQLRINAGDVSIVNTKMAGQFNLHIRSSLMGALVVAVPYIIWEIWRFVCPALSDEAQSKTKYFVFNVSLWFFTGLLFGYYMIAPLAVNFLTGYDVSASITNMIDVSSYLSTVVGVSFAAAVIFQLPLVIRLLATVGIVTSTMMKRYRKVAFAVIIVLSAIITPPDIFSQVLISIPMYGLFEYGIVIAQNIEKKRAKEESAIIKG